ncbi:MAG: MATE family efflux transporter [Phycisphaerae bacterium]
MSEKINTTGSNLWEREASLGYMLRLAGPMVITNISFTIMQFIDRLMISRVGTSALAAIWPAVMVSFLPSGFLLGVLTSVNTFVSQCFGRKQYNDCANYCWQSVNLGLVYSVISLMIFWPAAGWIFRMMGQPESIIPMQVTYLRIMLYCQFLAVFIWSSTQFFMGIHRPIITMWAAIIEQIINVFCNYVLIFGHFGFPQMGLAGAGWGTFIGMSVGSAIRMAAFLSGDVNRVYQSRKSFKIDIPRIMDLVKIGFPAGLAIALGVASWGIILAALIARFEKETMAATTAVLSCMNVSFMPVVGISTALTAAVGKSIGSGRKELAVKQIRMCVRIAMVYMGFIGICFLLFRYQIMKFWAPLDDKVVAAGVNILIIAAIFQLFDAPTITYTGALRGAGDTVWLALVSSFGVFIILGLGGWLMVTFFPQTGEFGPWSAALAEIMFVATAHHYRFKSKKWMRIDLFKRRVMEMPAEIGPAVE